jgi:DNA-binding transcriptional MerR regulator
MAIPLIMPEKLYFSIGEVAAIFKVNPSLIRFWEKEFDIIKPHKNKKGDRLFTNHDIDTIRNIYRLVKERGFTLQGAREQLKHTRGKDLDNAEILKALQKIRSDLLDLQRELERQ